MRNYVLFGKGFAGQWLMYAYIDLPENFAASVLAKYGVLVRLDRVQVAEGEKYILVHVRVRSKDRQKFLDAMEDLKAKMLIYGHRDYESHGGELIRELEMDIIDDALQDEKLMKRLGLADKNIVIVDG